MLAGFSELVASRASIDARELYAAAGLPPDLKPDPAVEISLNAYARLLQLAALRLRDDCFGLTFASAFPRGGAQALGYLLLNAHDVKTCIECLCQYVRLQSDGVSFALTEESNTARVAVSCSPAFVAPRKQVLEFIVGLMALRFQQEFGSDWMPLRAEFSYRKPAVCDAYVRIFGNNVEFECPATALTMRSELLHNRNQGADCALFGVMKGVAERELAALDRSRDIVWRVDEYVASNLALRAISLEGCASAVDRGARQLQSELKRHGTTFEDEVNRVRRSLAKRYLLDSDMALTEIALLVGFSELSAFTRAARGWFGMPPSQWRQQARAGAIEVV